MTADGTYTYTWDSENRLIEITTWRENGPLYGDKWLRTVHIYRHRAAALQDKKGHAPPCGGLSGGA